MSVDEREQQVRALLPVVKQLARRINRMIPSAEVDDLVGDGSIGLIRAVDGFDPTIGPPLEHYAKRVILGAMLNGIRRLDPVSERVRRTIRHAERERFARAHDTGTLPTLQEMEAVVPGLARARVDAHRGTPLSLDVPLPSGERLEPDLAGDPQAIAEVQAYQARVRDAIETLPPRQRRVVVAHYFREDSLRVLHRAMGISPQRVSQLHLLALAHLRMSLAESA